MNTGHERGARRRRRGMVTVESLVTSSLTLLLLFGFLDVGLAIVRYNALAEAARSIARYAIISGTDAATGEQLGPESISISANDSHELADVVACVVPTMNASDVNIEVMWLDESNDPDSRVRVRVSYQHQPLTNVFWPTPVTLEAVSTMRIIR